MEGAQLAVKQRQPRVPLFFVLSGLLLLLAFSIGYSLINGQADISVNDIFQILLYKSSQGSLGSITGIEQSVVNIIWFVRTPRVILSIFVGMGLAISGSVMQAVVQNPLADPYILGISSGASLGATFAIMIGFGSVSLLSQFSLAFGAFIGAAFASFFVLLLASIGGKMTATKLVLSGTVIGSLCGSASSLIIFLANNMEGMKSVTFWSMGSLASASWNKIPLLALVVVLLTLFFMSQHRILNTMLLGDEAAVTLGISLSKYRRFYMLLSALLTAIIVANSGMIGFVGLIIPHIVRSFCGSNHKILLPVSAFLGGLFLLWADVISRTLLANTELPIGIITSLVGAPVFIYIIIKKEYQFGG